MRSLEEMNPMGGDAAKLPIATNVPAPVEGTLSLKQAIRLLLAHAAGNATGLDSNPAFKSLDGSKTRVAGTISGGTRTITTRDGA